MTVPPLPPAARAAAPGRFALLLLLILLATLFARTPQLTGDASEYTLMTLAVANHGTPEIRAGDLAAARALLPADFDADLDRLEQGLRDGAQVPLRGFYRGLGGQVQALHFFAYSALAALPFKLLQAAGMAPFKCYLALNLACVFVLGMSLLRVFGSAPRALFGLALFMLCGGWLYLDWSSPELMTASLLLSALLLDSAGAPLLAGALGGLAALQNPTAVFFLGFAPLLRLCQDYRADAGWRAALRAGLRPRRLLGLTLGLAIFALAPLFNLLQFGVPSLIAKVAADASLMSGVRLFSFYFDLSQGMLVAVPALAPWLLAWTWRERAGAGLGGARRLAVLLLAVAMTLALAVPTLAIQNWNSSAAGVMRYAFWSAMPLLYVLLWQLRASPAWPMRALLALLLLQALAMANAKRYGALEFSPLARAVLRHATAWHNPEPELFAERVAHTEIELTPERISVYELDGKRVKTLYNRGNLDAEQTLCGPGRALAADNRVRDSAGLWRYIDGAPRCVDAGAPMQRYRLADFLAGDAFRLGGGWSRPESGGGIWNGTWSDGDTSTLTLALPAGSRHAGLLVIGHYFDGNGRTRVRINGRDLGWQRLRELPLLPLPAGATSLTVELVHEAPYQPPAGQADRRRIAFFLQEIALLPAPR